MKKRIVLTVRMLMLVLVLTIALSAVICRYHIKVTEYDVPLSGMTDCCRIVCLSDLHSVQYGRDNARLLEKVSSQHPDGIFVLGDMMNSDADEEELQQFLTLMKHLRAIAPVYFFLWEPRNGLSAQWRQGTDPDAGRSRRSSLVG